MDIPEAGIKGMAGGRLWPCQGKEQHPGGEGIWGSLLQSSGHCSGCVNRLEIGYLVPINFPLHHLEMRRTKKVQGLSKEKLSLFHKQAKAGMPKGSCLFLGSFTGGFSV